MTKTERLRAELSRLSLDAALLFDPINLFWFSGLYFTDGAILITKNSAHLLTDFRYLEAAEKAASEDFSITITEDRKSYLSVIFKQEAIGKVGVEGNGIPLDTYEKIKESHGGVRFLSLGDTLEVMREIKTEDEILAIRKAQDITDGAFSHILGVLTPNMTEIEVAAELEYFMRRNGADGFAFDTIAVSGDASAMPHGVPRNEKLHRGFLTMDFGAKLCGYCSDMTRTVVIGRADPEIKKVYDTVLSAQRAALAYLREGADAGIADKIARDIIECDYPGTFGHSLGHSVGLLIHENPRLSKKSFGRALRAGEIVTVEPGIYLPGKYGCRIEDMVAITEDGVHNFTKSDKSLIEIL